MITNIIFLYLLVTLIMAAITGTRSHEEFLPHTLAWVFIPVFIAIIIYQGMKKNLIYPIPKVIMLAFFPPRRRIVEYKGMKFIEVIAPDGEGYCEDCALYDDKKDDCKVLDKNMNPPCSAKRKTYFQIIDFGITHTHNHFNN